MKTLPAKRPKSLPLSPAPPAAPSPLGRDDLERIAEIFRVFSEATRLAILQALREGEQSVNELVEKLGTTQANISKQLRVLYDARLLARSKRGTQVFYSIDDEMISPLCELVCGKLNRDATRNQFLEFSI
jgi:DNA-binding transcriptional ArsR family regulator